MKTNSLWLSRFSKLTPFQKGTLKAKSLGNQRYYLKSSRKALKVHDAAKAQMWLRAWKIERSFYFHLSY